MNNVSKCRKSKQQHVAISACTHMSDIILPKLKRHGIIYFDYFKIYEDHSVIRLCTHKEWLENYFEKGYINQLAVPEPSLQPQSIFYTQSSFYLSKKINYYIWMNKDYPEMFTDGQTNFDIGNGITIAHRNHDSVEYYCFGTTRNNTSIINNFYINNLDLLHSYCYSFKEQAKNLIQYHENNKVIIVNDTSILPQPSIQLSNRQLACANLLIKGMKYKEIGRQLNISHRTVETHIDNIKTKLNCDNKAELIFNLINVLN